MCDLLQSVNWERLMSEGNMLYPLLLGLHDEIVEGKKCLHPFSLGLGMWALALVSRQQLKNCIYY